MSVAASVCSVSVSGTRTGPLGLYACVTPSQKLSGRIVGAPGRAAVSVVMSSSASGRVDGEQEVAARAALAGGAGRQDDARDGEVDDRGPRDRLADRDPVAVVGRR